MSIVLSAPASNAPKLSPTHTKTVLSLPGRPSESGRNSEATKNTNGQDEAYSLTLSKNVTKTNERPKVSSAKNTRQDEAPQNQPQSRHEGGGLQTQATISTQEASNNQFLSSSNVLDILL